MTMISASEAHERAKRVNNYAWSEKFGNIIIPAANSGKFNVKIYGCFCLAEIEYLENRGYKVLYDYDKERQGSFLSISW